MSSGSENPGARFAAELGIGPEDYNWQPGVLVPMRREDDSALIDSTRMRVLEECAARGAC